MAEKLLTILEAAELLRCHPETLRLEIRKGHLQAGKIGRDYRVSAKRLNEYWLQRGGESLFNEEEDVEAAFKLTCLEQGADPDTVIKNLMTSYVQKARATGKEGQEEQTEGIQDAVKRRQQQAKVKL